MSHITTGPKINLVHHATGSQLQPHFLASGTSQEKVVRFLEEKKKLKVSPLGKATRAQATSLKKWLLHEDHGTVMEVRGQHVGIRPLLPARIGLRLPGWAASAFTH